MSAGSPAPCWVQPGLRGQPTWPQPQAVGCHLRATSLTRELLPEPGMAPAHSCGDVVSQALGLRRPWHHCCLPPCSQHSEGLHTRNVQPRVLCSSTQTLALAMPCMGAKQKSNQERMYKLPYGKGILKLNPENQMRSEQRTVSLKGNL